MGRNRFTKKMKLKITDKRFFAILVIDCLVLGAVHYAAYLVRFDFRFPPEHWDTFKQTLPFVLLLKLAGFYSFKLYHGMWRYTSLADLLNIIKATTISTLIITFILLYARIKVVSRSVFIIDWCFTIFFISGFRISVRLFFQNIGKDKLYARAKQAVTKPFSRRQRKGRKLIIIGAGDCGEKIYREIQDNAQLRYNVVGFLDDNPAKKGKTIHSTPVLGPVSSLKKMTLKMHADEVLISIPSATAQQMRNIIAMCEKIKIPFKTVPGMGELINGKVTLNAIREVAYHDLLGRETVKLDQEQIGAYLENECVLVTGAGGSIGAELCRQICRFKPIQIILYERAESPLYEIELELKQEFKHVKTVPVLADVCQKGQLKRIFETFKPQTVFHAAAYKHVPMLESQPWKAVENNIMGTLNLIETAKEFKIERFVFVSTDKAVRPANIMGATKRVTEMLVQSQNSCEISNTRFMIVRFGNVVGSVGSVLPLFKKQIARMGPVTVTHPEVTRYFMTIPEACQLILQAGAMGRGGEIFLLDMGIPIKIDGMARDLIRLSGFEPDVDIKIEYIGLRPGEKLYEELITDGEGIVPTNHEKIMVLKGSECNPDLLNGQIQKLDLSAKKQDAAGIKDRLKEIVSEYSPADEK